jgi:hypothetical protein
VGWWRYSVRKIDIPLKTKDANTTESVCEITGIAIPSMFELRRTNKMNAKHKKIDRMHIHTSKNL